MSVPFLGSAAKLVKLSFTFSAVYILNLAVREPQRIQSPVLGDFLPRNAVAARLQDVRTSLDQCYQAVNLSAPLVT